jgi:hypothetical protein
MSQRHKDYEDFLRRVLHSAADSVEPAEDGLAKIRARLTRPYPLPVAWVMAAYSEVARRAAGGLHSVWAWAQAVLGSAHARGRVVRPGTPHRRRPARSRLATALIVTAFVGAVSVSALTPPLRQTILHTGALIHSIGSGGSAGSGSPRVNGHGSTYPLSGGAVTGTAPSTQNRQRPKSATCAAQAPILAVPVKRSIISVSPAPCAGSSASPSPVTSPSPSTSPSPVTSPSPSTSPSPVTSPSPSTSPSPVTSPSPSTSPSPVTSPSPSTSPSPVTSPSPSTSPSPLTSASPGPAESEVAAGRQPARRHMLIVFWAGATSRPGQHRSIRSPRARPGVRRHGQFPSPAGQRSGPDARRGTGSPPCAGRYRWLIG